jgi:RNA polymerase sigma-70 factor (ECF subfamily)
MTPAAELELVRQARAGDEAAFGALLNAALPVAYRLACGMLQDRQLAEDAVQEAALMAWRKMERLRPGSGMQPWFLGIVANQCRTIRRGPWWSVVKTDALRRSSLPLEDQVAGHADLRRALSRLKHDQRVVILLYYYLDLSLHEIAAVTGASFAAVRGRLYRGIRQLRPGLEVLEFQP